jgi:restriction system protein
MSLSIGIGIGIGMGPDYVPPRNASNQEQLYEDTGETFLQSAGIWLPNVFDELTSYLLKRPQALLNLPSRRFEELIADIFKNNGFDTQLTPQTRDQGYDILAVNHTEYTKQSPCLIECKRYSEQNKVGVGIVRQLLGVVVDQKAKKGILATTSIFTSPADQFVERNTKMIEKADYQTVVNWLHNLKLC